MWRDATLGTGLGFYPSIAIWHVQILLSVVWRVEEVVIHRVRDGDFVLHVLNVWGGSGRVSVRSGVAEEVLWVM